MAPVLRPPRPGAPQVGAELSVSSATCCSRVLQLPSCKEGLCRRGALLHPLPHPSPPPRPRASRPAHSPEPAPGARGRRAAAERGGGGKGRQGAARPAFPLGKSSGSLLLAKANTALFFPDRANAPGTRAVTHRAPVECSASSGKAPGVQSRPWANSQDSSARRGRPEARRVPAWPQRPRTSLHHLRAAEKERQHGNPASPLAAEDAVAQAGCGLPAPSRRGGDSNLPPPPLLRGAGPEELSLPGAGPGSPAAGRRERGEGGRRAAIWLEGDTRGARFGGRCRKAERGDSRSDQTSLGMSCRSVRNHAGGGC